MKYLCICWVFTHILLEILIFKGLTARRLYTSFGVKGLTSQKRLIVAATAMRVSDLTDSPLVQYSSGIQRRNDCLPLSKTAQAVNFLLGTSYKLGSNNGRNPSLFLFVPPGKQWHRSTCYGRFLMHFKRTILNSAHGQRPFIFTPFQH
jgi:hypothetical protein